MLISYDKKVCTKPYVYTKRISYFTCIHGKVAFIIKDNDGKYHEIITNAEEPILLCVPKNVSSAHLNLSNNISRILTLADLAWRPNDNEMKDMDFNDYDWSKWKHV